MADDLVFSSSDPFGDLEQNMLTEDVLSTDLLNIPQIETHFITSLDDRHGLFHTQNTHQVNNSTAYTPITQLMKQTEQLTASLEQPLNHSRNQSTTFSTVPNNHIFNMNNLPSQMLSNSSIYANSSSPSTQCLVIGGQRIALPVPQQNSSHNNSQTARSSNIMNQPQQINQAMRSQNVINPNMNISSTSKNIIQVPMNTMQNINTSPNVHLTINNSVNTVVSSSSASSVNNVSPKSLLSTVNTSPKTNTGLTMSNVTKRTDNLRGQILKTADQRLMLITEVNGKRVMYVIKPNSDGQQGVTLSESGPLVPAQMQNMVTVSQNASSTLQNVVNTPLSNINKNVTTVQTTFSNSHSETSINSSSTSTFTNHSVPSVKNENTSPARDSVLQTSNLLNPIISTKEYAMKIKEKLKNFPVNLNKLKTPLNLLAMDDKSMLSKINPDFINNQRTVQINPISLVSTNTLKKKVDDLDTVLNESKPASSSIELADDGGGDDGSGGVGEEEEEDDDEDEDDNEDDEEEDGQEIEFSENDITANEEDEFMDTQPDISEQTKKICSDGDDDDDDDDSLPLSQLKHDIDEPMQVAAPRERDSSTEGGDSIPLSVVAASLKKAAGGDTKKKAKSTKGKKEKKKKDPREPPKPMRAYQMFFRELQAEIKEKEPQLTFGEISKKIAGMWEKVNADKKKVYQDRQTAAKVLYDEKMKKYQEMLAKESKNETSTLTSSITSNADIGADIGMTEVENGEQLKSKKVVKRNKKRNKKSPPKLIIESESIEENLLAEVNDSDEIPIETVHDEPMKVKKVKLKNVSKQEQDDSVPSSPSLPSSDGSSDDDDEDSEIAISRIRQQAADMIKQIKEEKGKDKKVLSKLKTKESLCKKSKTNSNNSPRIHVETISEKEEIQLPMKKPPLEKMRRIEKKSDANVKEKVEKTKEKVPEKEEMLPAPVPKPTFKIPKKSILDNGQNSAGPRLCIRESCDKAAKTTRERGSQYCSNECLVLYCREVFDSWVLERQMETT